MKVVLEVVDTPKGGVCIIPSEGSIKQHVKLLETEVSELRKQTERLRAEAGKEQDVDRKEALLDDASAHEIRAALLEDGAKGIGERGQEIRKRLATKVRTLEFEVNPYTYGMKLEAEEAATTFDGMTPRLNKKQLELRLAAGACGMSLDEFKALPETVASALVREAMEMSEPDPEKIDFFDSLPTS